MSVSQVVAEGQILDALDAAPQDSSRIDADLWKGGKPPWLLLRAHSLLRARVDPVYVGLCPRLQFLSEFRSDRDLPRHGCRPSPRADGAATEMARHSRDLASACLGRAVQRCTNCAAERPERVLMGHLRECHTRALRAAIACGRGPFCADRVLLRATRCIAWGAIPGVATAPRPRRRHRGKQPTSRARQQSIGIRALTPLQRVQPSSRARRRV